MHPGKLLLGEAWLFIRSKICYYITVNCVIHAFLDDLCILLVINNFDLQGFGSCWWLFFFLSLVIVTWCYVWIYIHHFICCGRRPTALHDRGRDSDDDDYQNRDYDVAALANNLSQAFRYGIYSNDDVDEVPFKFFSKNSVQLITFFFLGGGGGQLYATILFFFLIFFPNWKILY